MFINKIRPIAEKTGICKVRPPPVSAIKGDKTLDDADAGLVKTVVDGPGI